MLANPLVKREGLEVAAQYLATDKTMHRGLGRNRSNYFNVTGCEFRCAEKSFVTAGREWHNRPLCVGKIVVDAVRDPRPEFVKAIIENNHSSRGQGALGSCQVVCRDLRGV